MKPLKHAVASAGRYGGLPDDYLEIHNFMDSTKSAMADVRHRAVLHSAFGIFIVEKVYGTYITNSDGKKVSVRDVAEDHVMEDLGCIPSLENWLVGLPIQPWMISASVRNKKPDYTPVQVDKESPNRITVEGKHVLRTVKD